MYIYICIYNYNIYYNIYIYIYIYIYIITNYIYFIYYTVISLHDGANNSSGSCIHILTDAAQFIGQLGVNDNDDDYDD